MAFKDSLNLLKNHLLARLTAANLTYFFLAGFVAGIYLSDLHRVISTISWIGLVVVAMGCVSKAQFQKAKQNKIVLLFCLVFFLYAGSSLLTDFDFNSAYAAGSVLLKIPFLLLPPAILFLPRLSTKRYHSLLWIFMLFSFFIGVKSVVYFGLYSAEVLSLIDSSETIPLPLNHVRFSLMLCLAIFFAGYLFLKKVYFVHRFEVYFNGFCTVFLFFFLHLLAVRSGLLAFYVLVASLLVVWGWRTRRFKLVFGSLAGLLLMPVLAYFLLSPFRGKVKNTLTDLSGVQHEYFANFQSITARIFSYKVALEVIQENPVLGVGVGNLERETQLVYIQNYREIKPEWRLKPHNQFLFSLVAFGGVGTLVFLLAMYGVLVEKRFRSDVVLMGQFLILTVSFVFESTLETQLGANFSLCFLILPIYYSTSNPLNHQSNKDNALHH